MFPIGVIRHFEQKTKGRGYLLHMCSSHANAFYHSLPTMVAFEVLVLTESLSI